jgi:translation elongation factor EF-4
LKLLLVLHWRDNKEVYISNPTNFPDVSDTTLRVKEIQEPVVKASIIVPEGTRKVISLIYANLIVGRVFRGHDGTLLFTARRGSRAQIP